MGRYQIYGFIISFFMLHVSSLSPNQWALHTLVPEKIFRPDHTKVLDIFCYAGTQKHIAHLFRTTKIHMSLTSDNYKHYYGSTVQEVLTEYDAHQSSWSIISFTWKSQDIKLNSFNSTCVGIESSKPYQLQLKIVDIDYWKVVMLCAGVVLFFLAPRLSENSLFFYICGVCLGVAASFLILVYAVGKLLPGKPLMCGAIIGGWAVGIFILGMIWDNIRLIIVSYQTYVISYLLITGTISFLVCYRIGPPTNPRSKNIIKWALQSAGLLCMSFCTEYNEAAVAIAVINLTVYNFPDFLKAGIKSYWKRKFPPKIKLLTDEEFYEQGVKETKRGLNELRQYCNSSECNQWRAVLKLKDPIRFAQFMEGESHLNNDEILNYENDSKDTIPLDNLTDDESEEDERPLTSRISNSKWRHRK